MLTHVVELVEESEKLKQVKYNVVQHIILFLKPCLHR